MNEVTLEIVKIFDASPEAVFDAWTDPAQVAEWYGPEGFGKSDIQEFDVREGGAYALTMHSPDGAGHELRGIFKRIDRPRTLSFTWQWVNGGEDGAMGKETLVTVELQPKGEKTEMHFTHTGFANDAIKDSHQQGWTGSFAKLARLLD